MQKKEGSSKEEESCRGKSLVVVESPGKAKTINKILGSDFVVKSCMGHVRDLPPKELGIDLDDNFRPSYVTIRGKGKVITELRKAAKSVESIYLATDPDREGEAIAWHVGQEITKKEGKLRRILFNEITPRAVRDSIEHSKELDVEKVNAQQARRVLDRLVGYEISPLLWKVIHSGLSAGRVQSVALRLICEQDNEIAAFEPVEYWSIDASLSKSEGELFKARLLQIGGEKAEIPNELESIKLVAALSKASYVVKLVKKREQRRKPAPPFTTSTLQQECARRLRFSVKRTDMVAQQLYEGIEMEGEVRGLITYMRTDSTRVSDDAINEVRSRIDEKYGAEYLPKEANKYRAKRGAQDAHEAIRPTSVLLEPQGIKELVTNDQAKMYDLIWKRFVASQMRPQVMELISVDIEAAEHLLRANGSSVKFPGFTLLYTESKDKEDGEEEKNISKLPVNIAEGDKLTLAELFPEQHFTKPPPRFTEASLVREMEAQGIGRPSTYAQIITTIQDREYVEKIDNRAFMATERGQTVNQLLVETFPQVFNVEFTAKMEDKLDQIEEGKADWVDSVREFYGSWKDILKDANERRKELKQSLQEESSIVCEECGLNMIIKWGRNGRFLACPGYPECKNTKPLEGEQALPETDEICDECAAPMVVKTGRYGRFIACTRYPDCKGVKPFLLGVKCPEEKCDGEIVEKQSRRGKVFYGCNNYPDCKFASWDKPIDESCPQCEAPLLYERTQRSEQSSVNCRICKYTRSESPETIESPEKQVA